MQKEIKLPKISEDSDEAVIADILVSEGDEVKEEDSLIAVDSDKATVEVPAEEAGTIVEIRVKESDSIKTGDVLLIMEVSNGQDKEGDDDGKESSNEKETDEETEETSKKKKADKKTEEEPDQEQPQNEDKDDEDKDDGDEQKKEKPKEEAKDIPDEEEDKKEPQTDTADVPAAPLAKQLARELGIKIQSVKPDANDDNRITREDVMAHAKKLITGQGVQKPSNDQPNKIELPDFSQWGETESVPLSSIRKATAKTTTLSWTNIPHVTQFDEADITQLMDFLEKTNEKEESKITLTAVLIKVLSMGLEKFPDFNSSLDYERNELILKKYFNIGIAADTPHGLMIPIIKKTNEKPIIAIAEEMTELAEKARNKKLKKDEMQGGNITISNLGGIGGTGFTPVIFPPQVAILGVSRTTQKLDVDEDDELFKKSVLPLALSYDHRVIDGANSARFLRWICEALEEPMNLVMG
ncbi:MAG: 2-oxo acid dehydrogenase subunit E2 [Marinoscillum sp.]